jgi:hypothetical protein
MEGPGSVQIMTDPHPEGSKTYGYYGSGSTTLLKSVTKLCLLRRGGAHQRCGEEPTGHLPSSTEEQGILQGSI